MSNRELKIFILFNFSKKDGGGSTFLKSLKKEIGSKGLLCKDPFDADIIIFNSHHEFYKLVKLKFKYPKKKFIHRMDGPLSSNRKHGNIFDKLIYQFNLYLADATIFQSQWSLSRNLNSGLKLAKKYKIIHNSSDSAIFNGINKIHYQPSKKCKLISSSWSFHPNKGIDILNQLDNSLDFNKYEMVFIGNEKYKFKNIKNLGVMSSELLGKYLKSSDIYISTSKIEACSNSLIEAVSCGLPSITRNCSSNSEIVKDQRLLYNDMDELLSKLDKVRTSLNRENNYKYNFKSISTITNDYIDFSREIYEDINNSSVNYITFLKLVINIFLFKFLSKLRVTAILKFLI